MISDDQCVCNENAESPYSKDLVVSPVYRHILYSKNLVISPVSRQGFCLRFYSSHKKNHPIWMSFKPIF